MSDAEIVCARGGDAGSTVGRMVAGDLLAGAAARFRNRESLFCAGTGRRFTFGQTNERSNRLAHALLNLGLRKREVVAFLCNNRAEIVEIYFALGKVGLVGVPLNYRLAPGEVVTLMRAMGATALIFADRFITTAAAVREALPTVRHHVAIGIDVPSWALRYEVLLADASAEKPSVDVREDDPFYFNLTSGTTGLPKSYVLSHYHAVTASLSFTVFDVTSRDVVLTAIPAFGRIGMSWIGAAALWGARNVLTDFAPSEMLRLIKQESVTITNIVPTMAAMMLAEPGLPLADLTSLRALIFAGAMFPGPLREHTTAALSPHVWEYYGMQEVGVLTLSTPEDRVRHPESVGLPGWFAQVRIEQPDGSQANPGQIGEILGRAPPSVATYFEDPKRSAEAFRDGWVRTGDLGCLDEEGYLYIRGRVKDTIVTGGQNVHAAEVEETILCVPGVAECAVFGLPDEIWGERVATVVVATPGTLGASNHSAGRTTATHSDRQSAEIPARPEARRIAAGPARG
jgi:fatty-acyl-CoA synthase